MDDILSGERAQLLVYSRYPGRATGPQGSVCGIKPERKKLRGMLGTGFGKDERGR